MRRLVPVLLAAFLPLSVWGGPEPFGSSKDSIFRIEVDTEDFTNSFLCTGFVIRLRGQIFGTTAGRCNRDGFMIVVLFWKDWVNTFAVYISDGPGRDIALFKKDYLDKYFRVWDVGKAKVGDSVSVVGFSNRGPTTARCKVDSESNQPDRFYKTVKCECLLHYEMMGSPVVKDGKVAGVVTHLFRRTNNRAVFTSFPEAFSFLGR